MDLLSWVKAHREDSFNFLPANGVLTGSSAQLIWQYLRFNPKFVRDVDRAVKAIRDADHSDGVTADELESALAFKWGLSEFVHYKCPLLPKRVSFKIFVAGLVPENSRISREQWIGLHKERAKTTSLLDDPFLLSVSLTA